MRLEAVLGDITLEEVDAIVNAAKRACSAGAAPTAVALVRFVCFDRTTLQAYLDRLEPDARRAGS